MTEPLFPCASAQTRNPPFWTTTTAVPKFPQNGGSTPTPCLDKAVHVQGGRGVNDMVFVSKDPNKTAKPFNTCPLIEAHPDMSMVWQLRWQKLELDDRCMSLLNSVQV